MKVTIVGSGFYGSTTALRIAEADIVDEVVMVDIIEDKPQGLALDMMQCRPIERFETRIVGSNTYEATAGSDVCVITAGLPRKPGMSRMDLLEVNAKIVGDVTRQLVAGSPDSILLVVSNPLDEMTALAAQVSGFPHERVMGQAGMLDTARFQHFVAERFGISPLEVEAITLGSHGDTMVPVPSQVKVAGKPLAEVADAETIEELVRKTGTGEPRSWASSRPARRTTPRRRPPPPWSKQSWVTPRRPCRCAPGWPVSTGSPTCTSAYRPSSAGTAWRRSSSCP